MTIEQIAQGTAIGAIFIYFIKQFFDYLKCKKDKTSTIEINPLSNKEILSELKLMNGNHLHTIQECIKESNQTLVNIIHQDNVKMIEILSRIEGKLK